MRAGNENLSNAVLLIGGTNSDRAVLEARNYEVRHWVRPMGTALPSDIDAVIMISDKIDLKLAQSLKRQCEQQFIPLAVIKADFEGLAEKMQKAVEEVHRAEEVDASKAVNLNPKEQTTMVTNAKKIDGRTNGENVQRAQEKIEFLRAALRKDATTPTETLQAAIVKRFKKGLTPTTIAQVRWNDFGVKYGARGKLIYKNQPSVTISARPVASASATDSNKLAASIAAVREVMREMNIQTLEIPYTGNVRVVQLTSHETEMDLAVH